MVILIFCNNKFIRVFRFEWGNPLNFTIFQAQMKYSPYKLMKIGIQPAVYVTAGIQDSRVPYWGPTKFVAKLRKHKLNEMLSNHFNSTQTPLLLRVYNGGHFSSTEETKRIQQTSEWITFILKNTK